MGAGGRPRQACACVPFPLTFSCSLEVTNGTKRARNGLPLKHMRLWVKKATQPNSQQAGRNFSCPSRRVLFWACNTQGAMHPGAARLVVQAAIAQVRGELLMLLLFVYWGGLPLNLLLRDPLVLCQLRLHRALFLFFVCFSVCARFSLPPHTHPKNRDLGTSQKIRPTLKTPLFS